MILSEKFVERLLQKGLDQNSPSPVLVTRECVRRHGSSEVNWVWRFYVRPEDDPSCSIDVTRHQALDLIDMYGLVDKHTDSDGTVYDTDDQAFLRKYNRREKPAVPVRRHAVVMM